jgi:hypothetical protein
MSVRVRFKDIARVSVGFLLRLGLQLEIDLSLWLVLGLVVGKGLYCG